MDEVYRLFDRRCRTDTALSKLAELRKRVRRFRKVGKTLGKLFSPNLDKALTFLDDSLLPATSNAVELETAATAKCKKLSIASAARNIFMLALPSICSVTLRPPDDLRRLAHCTMLAQDEITQ